MATATKNKPTTSAIPGGRYTAEKNPDGTWNVLDVPIFAEISKGERGNKDSIDREWMVLALGKANQRLKENYLPPLHIYHHGGLVDRTERAGFFKLRRIGKVTVDGKEISGLFADLVAIPEATFQSIERGELPYRSVEVFDWSDPEINSLALLPDEVPFFRFEMLTIGTKIETTEKIEGGTLALAVRSAGKGRAYLFSFKGGAMPEDEKKPEEKPVEEKKELAEAPAGDAPAPAAPSKLEEMVSGMAAKLDALVSAIAGMMEKPHDPAKEAQPEGGEMKAKPAEDKSAELSAVVHGLRAKLAEQEKAAGIKALVDDARKRLAGWHITDEMAKDIEAFAAAGKDQIERFVKSIQGNVARDPGATTDADALKAKQYAAEVMAYAYDPDVMEKAAKFHEHWVALDRAGMAGMSAARFIEVNVGKPAAK